MHWQYGHFSTETYTYWLSTGSMVTPVQKHTPTGYALAVWSLRYRNIQLLAMQWQYGHFGTETYTYWLRTGSMVTAIQHTPTGYALAMWSLQYRNIHLLAMHWQYDHFNTETFTYYSRPSLKLANFTPPFHYPIPLSHSTLKKNRN